MSHIATWMVRLINKICDLESINHSGLQRDSLGYVPSSNEQITVRVDEVARRNGGHIESLIHRKYISMQ
jgi:hypothetical protein